MGGFEVEVAGPGDGSDVEVCGYLDEVRVGAIIFGPCCVFVVCGVT